MTSNAPHDPARPRFSQFARKAEISVGYLAGLVITTALAAIVSAGKATAGTPCDELPHAGYAGSCDCGVCGSSHLRNQNPIFQTLDTVAGGIEKVFGLDRCSAKSCRSSCCDNGCDAAYPMMFGSSATPIEHHHPRATPNSGRVHQTPEPAMNHPRNAKPALPIVPPLAPAPSQPSMTKPRIVTPESAPTIVEPTPRESAPKDPQPRVPEMTAPRLVPTETNPRTTNPRTLPKPNDDVQPEPKKDGSIFDALDDLDDPFQEDAARLRRQFGSIRPTGMQSSTVKVPAYRAALPPKNDRPAHRPAPRLIPQPIGSGLRPATKIEPLRPVSHEEPIELQSMRNRRILAPYRASR